MVPHNVRFIFACVFGTEGQMAGCRVVVPGFHLVSLDQKILMRKNPEGIEAIEVYQFVIDASPF